MTRHKWLAALVIGTVPLGMGLEALGMPVGLAIVIITPVVTAAVLIGFLFPSGVDVVKTLPPAHQHVYAVSGLAALRHNTKLSFKDYTGHCDCGAEQTFAGVSWQAIARGEWFATNGWSKDHVRFASLAIWGK